MMQDQGQYGKQLVACRDLLQQSTAGSVSTTSHVIVVFPVPNYLSRMSWRCLPH